MEVELYPMNGQPVRLGTGSFGAVVGVTWVLLAMAAAATSAGLPLVPVPVQLTTYVGDPPAGVHPQFSWRVTYDDHPYMLNIVDMRVFSSRVMPLDIDAAVALYQTKFRIGGEKAALEQFARIPPGQLVTVKGFIKLDPNARYLLLDQVEPATSPAGH